MTRNTSATFWRVAKNHLESARYYRQVVRGTNGRVKAHSGAESLMCADLSADWYRSAMEYRKLARNLQRQGL